MGNFVEVKKADLKDGAKVSHLSYIEMLKSVNVQTLVVVLSQLIMMVLINLKRL